MALSDLVSGELYRLNRNYTEGLNVITKIQSRLATDIAALKAHADYGSTATAGEQTAIDTNQTTIAGILLS